MIYKKVMNLVEIGTVCRLSTIGEALLHAYLHPCMVNSSISCDCKTKMQEMEAELKQFFEKSGFTMDSGIKDILYYMQQKAAGVGVTDGTASAFTHCGEGCFKDCPEKEIKKP